jgi:DNA-binding Lrp family transcriptional regulator
MGEEHLFESAFNEKYSLLVRRILRMLSDNSRVSVSELSRELGVARHTVVEKIAQAEKEFGLKYTLEFDEEALGLNNPRLILARFERKPDPEEVARLLKRSHIPQVVAVVDGKSDLLIYANAESTSEYVYWDKTTQVLLSKYGVLWQPSDLAFRHIGFFPLRTELLQRLDIPKKYKDLLLLLNEDSRMTFAEMSHRLGIRFDTVTYTFGKLMKLGYIKRFTTVMTRPPASSMTYLFGKYTISEGFEDDSMKMRKEITFIDDRMPLVSRCLFSAQLVGSYDFFFVGAYDDQKTGYERLIKYYRKRFSRHKVKAVYGSIGGMLVGDFPIRNLDVRKEFNMIKWIPDATPVVTKPGG